MGNQHFRLELDIEKAKRLYETGLTHKEVAKRLNTSKKVIWSRFNEIDYKSRVAKDHTLFLKHKRLPLSYFSSMVDKVDKETQQIILGSLLGDGCVRIRKGGITPNYIECHQETQQEYLKWKGDYIKKYFQGKYFKRCSDNVHFYHTPVSKKWFYYYKMFYPNGKKHITKQILDRLDWLGIAVWYVDDGTFEYSGKRLAFTMEKKFHKMCFEYFKELGFFFKLSYPDSLSLRLSTKQTREFIKKIKPYIFEMPNCVHYKIGLNKYEKNVINN